MARILHTADLHLADGRPERWDALDAVLAAAEEREVDAVLVAGDLLDREGDHAALRVRVRERLEEAGRPVYILPGNHDRGAYAPGQDWGASAHLMLSEPVHATRLAGIRLLGVPFPTGGISFSRVRRRVRERMAEEEGPALLALHGTLIDASAPHIQVESREDEPDDRYFSIRTGELSGVGADYVALGHYHQHDLRRAGRVPVAYSGSPSPVGAHALGPRSAILVELEAGASEAVGGPGRRGAVTVRTERIRLPVPYRDRLTRWLTPFREREELESLAGELRERADPGCTLRVTLEGILAGMDEAEMARALDELREEMADRFASLEFDRRGVGLEPGRADLFARFRDRLREREEVSGPRGEELEHRALEIAARALKE